MVGRKIKTTKHCVSGWMSVCVCVRERERERERIKRERSVC